MKKIRSSQAAALCTKLSKTQLFPVSIIKFKKLTTKFSKKIQKALFWRPLLEMP